MKLCLVSDSYPTIRPHAGIAVYTRTAARALAARGHEVHVLVRRRPGLPEYGDKDFEDGPVKVHYRRVKWLPVVGRLAPALGEAFGIARALRALHAQFRFDLVEFPNFEGLGLVAQLGRIVPAVVRLHTSMAESVAAQERPPKPGERFMMWAERTSARLAAGVVTHSTPHRDQIAKTTGLRPIEVIPHGIEIPPLSDGPRDSDEILSIGRLTARKGAATLLAAAARVVGRQPSARFTIAGSDERHPLARAFRAEHPEIDPGRVTFPGFVSDGELQALFGRAAIYASASVYESFGLTFIEAMARGIPVVGCATSAMTEIIADGETGLLVPPLDPAAFGDAILRLLGDPALRGRMGEAGREAVLARYSAERMGESIERWYRAVLDRSSRNRDAR